MQKPYHLYNGAKIKFMSGKQRYTVRATSKRFTICTKPFNAQNTVLYTIIDWQHQIRGAENLIFGMGAETREQCLEMLIRLLDGDSEVSRRNAVPLDVERITHDKEVIYSKEAGDDR